MLLDPGVPFRRGFGPSRSRGVPVGAGEVVLVLVLVLVVPGVVIREVPRLEGGPAGVILGRFRDEASILRAAAIYEASERWLERWPVL